MQQIFNNNSFLILLVILVVIIFIYIVPDNFDFKCLNNNRNEPFLDILANSDIPDTSKTSITKYSKQDFNNYKFTLSNPKIREITFNKEFELNTLLFDKDDEKNYFFFKIISENKYESTTVAEEDKKYIYDCETNYTDDELKNYNLIQKNLSTVKEKIYKCDIDKESIPTHIPLPTMRPDLKIEELTNQHIIIFPNIADLKIYEYNDIIELSLYKDSNAIKSEGRVSHIDLNENTLYITTENQNIDLLKNIGISIKKLNEDEIIQNYLDTRENEFINSGYKKFRTQKLLNRMVKLKKNLALLEKNK